MQYYCLVDNSKSKQSVNRFLWKLNFPKIPQRKENAIHKLKVRY